MQCGIHRVDLDPIYKRLFCESKSLWVQRYKMFVTLNKDLYLSRLKDLLGFTLEAKLQLIFGLCSARFSLFPRHPFSFLGDCFGHNMNQSAYRETAISRSIRASSVVVVQVYRLYCVFRYKRTRRLLRKAYAVRTFSKDTFREACLSSVQRM